MFLIINKIEKINSLSDDDNTSQVLMRQDKFYQK